MFNSKIPSPARSLGGKSTPRRYKQKRPRSVCSPARSVNSVKLTAMIEDSFVVSPLPKRRSVLTDDTDIDMPKRQSWWKKLGESSRDVIELLGHKDVPESNNMIEENFNVEILSQEKKNYTFDLPESSDGESISSIVVPQRKLFTQKENNAQNKFPLVNNNREELPNLQKSHVDHVQEIDIRPKSLFNQAKKPRTKPIFPPALLNISTNKSIANKTELPVVESKVQVRNLFGNKPGNKRKNMFADFIVSESEDEIPEIQPKVFGFQKNNEPNCKMSYALHGLPESPTCSIVDIDIDDWKHLPSSTMVENEIEEQAATPSKRTRLSKLLDTKDMEIVDANKTINKTKILNKSRNSKNRSKQSSSPKIYDDKRKVNTSKKQADEIHSSSSINNNTLVPDKTQNANSSKQMKTFTVKEHEAADTSNVAEKENIDCNEIEKNTDHDEIEKDEQINSDNNEQAATPSKHTRLSKLLDTKDMEIVNANKTINKTKILNKSRNSKNRSKQSSSPKIYDDKRKVNTSKKQADEIHSSSSINNNTLVPDKTQNADSSKQMKTFTVKEHEAADTSNVAEKENIDCNEIEKNTDHDEIEKDEQINSDNNERTKKLEGKPQISVKTPNASDAEEDFTLEYEYDEEIFEHNEKSIENKVDDIPKVLERSKSGEAHKNIIHKRNSQDTNINDVDIAEPRKSQNHAAEEEHSSNYSITYNKQSVYHNSNTSNREIVNNASTKITHTTSFTHENQKNNKSKVEPPEAIMHQDTNDLIESYIRKERNSPRKTKSMVKHNLKPSLAPVRESTGFSDNTENSSANSGWDSHRTTRKTLRKTFGKDFTPRKSLRTLVMEKSAKRQTFNPDLHNISKYPHANSTELPVREEKIANRQTFNPDLRDISKHPHANSTELPVHDVNEQHSEDDTVEKRHTEIEESAQDINETTEVDTNEKNDAEMEESNQDVNNPTENSGVDSEMEESDQDVNETTEVDTNEKNNAEMEENIQDVNNTTENSGVDSEMEESDQDVNETTEVDTNEKNDAVIEESNQDVNNITDNSGVGSEMEESDQDVNNITDNSGVDSEMEESDQDVNETTEHSDDDVVENNHAEIEESDQDVNDTAEHSDDDIFENRHTEIEETVQESDHELSKRTRQTTLETYLEKFRTEKVEREKKIREDIMNSLKVCRNRNCFELPYVIPIPRTLKPAQKKNKPKAIKTTTLYDIPEELIEDMKYKPPKRFQPRNASWTTKRLYKFLETKLEPKYDYMARVRAEKLVATIYDFTKLVRRHEVAPADSINALKHEMARLKIVDTHYEFYHFFHEYMPREIRVKVNPDIVNKIQMPDDVFANIIR